MGPYVQRWSTRFVAVAFSIALLASVVVALPAGAVAATVLEGTVINASGTPVSGVCVSVSGQTGSGSATTASDGTYSISSLAAGSYYMTVDPTCGTVTSSYARQSIPSVNVTANSTTTQNVTLALGGTVSGTVTNASGGPVSGVCVGVSNATGFGSATTASDGTYTISSLGAGSDFFSADPTCGGTVTSSYARQTIPSVSITASSTTTQNVARALGGTVSGTVINASNAPIGGVCVIDITSSDLVTTASNGTYTISNQGVGPVTLIFDPTCTGAVTSLYSGSRITVDVTAGSPTTQNVALSLVSSTVPGAPSIGTAVAATASATVLWTGGTNGGSVITGYTVTADDVTSNVTTTDACPTSTSATSTNCTVAGLNGGDTYRFSVAAINSIGAGVFSSDSNPVTPTSGAGGAGTPTGTTNAPPPLSSTTGGSLSYGTPVSKTVASSLSTSLSQASNGSTGKVTIPAGALPSGTTVSVFPVTSTSALTKQIPAGKSYVASFAVTWVTPSGTSPTSTAPITMTISDSNIAVGDIIYMLTSSGPVAVGRATANGTVTITFSNDPTFVLTNNTVAPTALTLTSLSGQVGTALTLASSGGSGTGAVTYALTNAGTAGCVITGSALMATRPGTCTVTATKAASATYLAASSAATTVTFKVKVVTVQFRATKVNGIAFAGQTSIVSISGIGFYGKPAVASNEVGTSALVIRHRGNLLVVRIKVRPGSTPGWHSLSITLANGQSSHVRYFVKLGLRATRVNGFVLVGRTVLISINGTGFYGKPTVASNEVGTNAVVIHDRGNLLVVRVRLRSRSTPGWHAFTITLANGHSCQVKYLVRTSS